MEVKVKDLVLQVSKSVDPAKSDLDKYDDFLDELCEHREFQKEAIRTAIRFLLSGEYKNTEELAKENFQKNDSLKEFYTTFEKFKNKLEFPDKLACTIDLATATGKSWVMYGIAQIMLCEGVVDQVLILSPSITVKNELLKKFENYVINKNLRATLQDASIKFKVNPTIKDAAKTIKKGDICIDNVHKTYSHVTSSIEDSLLKKGERTLILNDECHHIMNPQEESSKTEAQAMKEWKKFLTDKKFNFKYIVGVTGTPYLANEYARDVVYRYSIMQAMEGDLAGNWVIKKVEYLKESSAKTWAHKLEEIYANHQRNKQMWKKAKKHITIFVTQTINKAEKLTNDIINFLMDKEKLKINEAEDRVLIITSKHTQNRATLEHVDEANNPVEWIISVSMLTEGWDVDNVFQIVPHEERAFNSKLLISQVLGRGLRVPIEYLDEQPTVMVYNHHKWGEAIRDLVEEVMDYEKRVRSYIVDKEKNYNFELYNLNYEKIEEHKKVPRKGHYKMPKMPELSTQSGIIKLRTTYYQVKEQKEREAETKIPVKMYPVDRVINDIVNKLAGFDDETGTKYASMVDKKKLKADIEKALSKVDPEKTGMLTEENKNRIERSFDVLKREATGVTKITRKAKKPFIVKTQDIPMSSSKISEFTKFKALIFEDSSIKASKKEDVELIEEALDEAKGKNLLKIENKYYYKCPLNIVILSHNNEREFGRYLTMPAYANKMDAWIKSVDRGFYDIPYSYRKGRKSKSEGRGSHQKWANFNPDIFLRIGKDILVVEIKSDEDITEVNNAKLKYAEKHFEELNKKQSKQKYYFKFLSPQDYPQFFEALLKGKYKNYVSNLMAELKGLPED